MKTKTHSMNPFPGLRPFRQDEDYLFFGREEQTMELLQRLGTHRFVAVVGTSGSGKSSLVRCGLLSELLGGKLLKAGTSWEVAVTHPGGNPLALLAEAILEADLYDRDEEHARDQLLATLSRSQFGLIEAIKQAQLPARTNFLLVVDQFEEIFRFNEAGQTQQEMASEFVSLLLEAVGQTEVPIYVVLTMRSDFIGDCGQFEGLAEMVNRGEFLIPRLSREQYKRIIESPIKVAGGRIEPRLLQRLLNDLGQQADQLPCLQHALMRTWSVWSERGETEALDLDDYQRVGRMSEALSLHADEVFDSLESDRQRELCAGMFKALTIQESENRGIRRPQRLAGLCQILEVPLEELRPIIDAFRQQHVTFLLPSPEVELTDKTIIDISHESLMRVWARLRRWVEEEAQAVGIYRRLTESAMLHDRGKAGLYRDPELGIALAWREASRPNRAWAERYHPGFAHAMDFLDSSQQAQLAEEREHESARQRELEQARMLAEAQRQRAEAETNSARRLRGMLVGTALIAVFAIGSSLVAFNSWREADRAKQAAELSENSAQQNALTAQAAAERATLQEAAAKQARLEAEENLTRARTAIDEFLVQVSDSKLMSTPGLQPLRAELLESAGKFYEEFLVKNPDNPELRAGLADAFFRIGFVNEDLDKHEQALAALDKAIKLHEAALQAHPADEKLRHLVARTWYEISRSRLGNDDYPGGDEAAKHAARLWDGLVREHPENIDYSKSLARACNILGNTAGMMNQPEQAFLAYQRSMEIRLDLLAQYPNDVELLHGLGESFNNIGLVVADSDQRLRLSERSAEFGAAAHRLRPQNVEYATDLTISYYVLSGRYLALNRKQQAIAAFQKGVEHSLLFIRANPAVPAMRERLATTLQMLRSVPFEAAQADEYVQIFRSVYNSFRGMQQQTVDDHLAYATVQSDFVQQIIKARKTLQRRELTSEEEAEIRDLRDGSLAALQKAVAAGFTDIKRLREDPLLADARTQAGFTAVIAQAETAQKASTTVADASRAPAGGDVSATVMAQVNKDRATGYLSFAVAQTGFNHPQQAQEALERSVAIRKSLAAGEPTNIETQLDLARALEIQAQAFWNEGRRRQAQELFQQQLTGLEEVLAKDPRNGSAGNQLAAAHRAWAEALADAGLSEKALEHYLRSLRQQPAAGPATFWVGTYQRPFALTLLKINQPEEYRKACSALLQQYAQSTDQAIRWEVGRICTLLPDATEPTAELLDLAANSQTWSTYHYGLSLYRTGRFEEAIADVMMRRGRPGAQEFLADRLVLAMAHFRLGHKAEALDWLNEFDRTSLQAVPDWVRSRHFLGIEYLVLRREANELIFGQPFSPAERLRRGLVLAQLGDSTAAEAELAVVSAALPDDPASHFAYVRALQLLGHQEQAALALNRAREILTEKWLVSAGDVELWRSCAETYRQLDRHDDVTDALRHAVAAQSLRVIQSPGQSSARMLLVRLNDELVQSLQIAGRGAETTSAGDELKLLYVAYGLPPIQRTVTDVFADSAQKEAPGQQALAALDHLIAAHGKSTADDNPVTLHLRGRLHQRRAEVLGDAARNAEAERDWSVARAAYEQLLNGDATNAELAGSLAEAMLNEARQTKWTVLQPMEATSAGGATLTPLADRSIRSSGAHPDKDDYTIKARTDVENIRAIALDVVPDESNRGKVGRGISGHYFVTEFEFLRRDISGILEPVPLSAAVADFEQKDPGFSYTAENAINGNADDGGWGIGPQFQTPHRLVIKLAQPLHNGPPDLTFIIRQHHFNAFHPQGLLLGRFRLSVSNDGQALERARHCFDASKLTDPWSKLAAAYAICDRHEEAGRYFGKALQRTKDFNARKQILEYAARFGDLVLSMAKQHSDDQQLQLAAARQLAEQGKMRLADKQPAQAQADLQKADDLFARLQAENPEPKWSVLTPAEMKSDAGETFAVEPDGSIFVTGPIPEHAVYTLKLRTELPTVSAIRLETIPDQRLPSAGAGRAGNGNFHIGEFKASFVPGTENGQAVPITFGSVLVDYEQSWNPASRAIDGNPRTCWDTHPRIQQPHWLLLACGTPLKSGGGYLSITLDEGITEYPKHGLGRFRLLATDEADVLSRTQLRKDFSASEVVDLKIALATVQAQQGQLNSAAASLIESLALATDRAARARIISQAASLPGVLEKLAEHTAGNGSFQAQLAEYFADRDLGPLAHATRENALAVLERQLAADPDDAVSASELGALLLSKVAATRQYWIDDETPAGARLQGDSPWEFVSRPDHPVFSGQKSTRRQAPARSQHFFSDATAGLKVGDGARLFAHVYLDPRDPPRTLMLQFCDGGWDHRAYWGEDLIDWGDKGTAGHAPMGPLPKAGEWVRLEVEPARVGLRVGAELNGWAFSQYGGTCYWDAAGCTHSFGSPWQKMAAAYHLLGDQTALNRLLVRHPEATAGIGDLHASQQDWEHAIIEYSKAIDAGTKDPSLFAARAEAYEKLERWELAAADWGDVDRYSADKKVRYGNPSFPALERRFANHGRLNKLAEQVQDCTELLKPERLGNEPWIFVKRGETYDQLREWDQARADYEQAIALCSPSDRATFQFYRARHFAKQCQWKQAADDVRQAHRKLSDSVTHWATWRDVALIYALAGDMEGYRQAAAEQYRQQPAGDPDADQNKWSLLTMVLAPKLVTSENQARLQQIATRIDSYWQPRLAGAICYRSGEYEKAAQLLGANAGGTQFTFLAAMVHHMLGHGDQAKQLVAEGNAWMREQRAQEPGGTVPSPYSWQDWAVFVGLQAEATDLILDPEAGSPRKLALTGQMREAVEAYSKALADAADEDSMLQLISELAQFEDVLTAIHQRLAADHPVQEVYWRMVERTAAQFTRQLDALGVQSSEDQTRRAALIASLIHRQDDVVQAVLKLRSDDALLHGAYSVVSSDWKNAAAGYAKVIIAKEDSIAWMVPASLWAYAGETGEHRKSCQQMYERFRGSTVANDIERCLKVMLLVKDGPPLPPDAVQTFYDSFAGKLTDDDRAWFLATRALLECRKGNYADAHQQLNESLDLEKKAPNAFIKALALSIRSLTYAHQKEVEQARNSLQQVKQVMRDDLKMDWNSDGLLKGSTVLEQVTPSHDRLIPEIIRREAEELIAGPLELPEKD